MITRPADRQPSCVFRVEQALKGSDDFMSFDQLVVAAHVNPNQLRACLHHLKTRAGVIDSLGSGGSLWWFYSGGHDLCSRTIDQRVQEPKGNRHRKSNTKESKQ